MSISPVRYPGRLPSAGYSKRSRNLPRSGSKNRTKQTESLPGRLVTVPFRLDNHSSPRWFDTSITNGNTTECGALMTSCAICCRSTVLPTMNGIYGTDALAGLWPSLAATQPTAYGPFLDSLLDVTPLQGSSFPHLSPCRALPWAGMSRPFRARYRNPVPGRSQKQWGSERLR